MIVFRTRRAAFVSIVFAAVGVLALIVKVGAQLVAPVQLSDSDAFVWWATTIGSAVMADMGIRTLLHLGRIARVAAETERPGQA